MTDIIERLRQTSRDFGMVAAVTALEAADEIERLRSALTEVLAFQSAKDVPSIHDWGRWRRVRDGIVAPVAEPKRKVIHVTESMGAALEGAGLTSCVGCGAPAGEGHMPGCSAANRASDDEDGDLYLRLHSLSKSLEGSGRIDEHDDPGAYSTVLDAMIFVRRTEADMERWSGKLDEIQQGVLDMRRDNERLRAALDRIAERTGSDDPCRHLVQIARDVLAPTAAPAGEPPRSEPPVG